MARPHMAKGEVVESNADRAKRLAGGVASLISTPFGSTDEAAARLQAGGIPPEAAKKAGPILPKPAAEAMIEEGLKPENQPHVYHIAVKNLKDTPEYKAFAAAHKAHHGEEPSFPWDHVNSMTDPKEKAKYAAAKAKE